MTDNRAAQWEIEETSASEGVWHALTAEGVLDRLRAAERGLGPTEVEARLTRYGENRIAEPAATSTAALFLGQFRSPLIAIMGVALVVVLVLQEYVDAAVVAVALLLNAVVGTWQERSAERTVRSLMRLVVPQARVLREGVEQDVPSHGLVPGDVVLLESGVRVPADVRLISVNALQVDESLLTGESLPVTKHVRADPVDAAVADRRSMAFAGSVVSSGRATALVVATGPRTELGGIATLVEGGSGARTPMQEQMAGFARLVGFAVLGVSVVAFGSGLLLGEAASDMFRIAVALAVANVPEGLPVATTVTLAIGVARMARRNAVIRHLPAVETLGSITVIGSDKTGTLTENRMTVQCIRTAGREVWREGGRGFAAGDSAAVRHTLLAGVLSNEAELSTGSDPAEDAVGDPTEVALLVAAARAGLDPPEVRAAFEVVTEVPFEPARRWSAGIYSDGGQHTLYLKGAPEQVLAMCDRTLTDNGEPAAFDPGAVTEAGAALAARGLRVLAFAMRPSAGPDDLIAGTDPAGLVFCGLQAMADPPRAGVRESVAACHDAGVRVVMVTGDHAGTARAIAGDLGITGDGTVLEGPVLGSMEDGALRESLREVSVFARVAPEQKLRIVTLLQESGEVVAVTGDGVNDAPALKAAQVGVAMGRSGTDVAREASDVVLTDDNFTSIVAAVEQGRITFDNIRKVTFFLISTAIATTLAILTTLWAGWPLLMVPAQILWLNLVTSGLQDMALAFEPGERGVLQRRPRRRGEGLLSRLLWERALISAVVMAAGTLWMFHREYLATGSLQHAQTVALTTLVLFQVFQAGNARSDTVSLLRMNPLSNPFLFAATTAALAVHTAALYLPPTQFVLRVEPVPAATWPTMLMVAASLLVVVELHKLARRHRPATPR